MKHFTTMIVAAVTLVYCHVLSATVALPDAEFSFSAVSAERAEAVETIGKALAPLGFGPPEVTNVRPDGFFRATYSSSDRDRDVSLRGPTSCVTVSIYTSRFQKSELKSAKQAAEIKETLFEYLRKISKPKVHLFDAGPEGGCVRPL